MNASGLEFEIAGFSEQGPRSENQDAYSTEAFQDYGLIALADGMGGEKSGRIAADTALEALRGTAPLRSVDEARRAVREADRLVTQTAEADPERLGGMGCAIGLLALTDGADGPGWIVAHVGDVRILSRSPDGLLRLETRDHTPAFARWEAGEITLDEIPDSAGANRLQRAVGRGGEADVGWIPAAPGWSWLLISDGIYKAMRLDELAAALSAPTSQEACRSIQAKVEERGADDNYTAVVVRAVGEATTVAAPLAVAPRARPEVSEPRSRRSAAGAVAMALAAIALALAGYAVWTATEASSAAADRTEIQQLQMEIDSLRLMVTEVVDPFGPSAPDAAPGAVIPQQTPPR